MEIPLDILKLIATFLIIPKMKLLDWIDEDELDINGLSDNPNAIQLLETLTQDPEEFKMIDWYSLSGNPEAIHMLEANCDMIEWSFLSMNPNAMHMLEPVSQHDPEKIDWKWLSTNPNAIHMLEANPNKIKMIEYDIEDFYLLHPDEIKQHIKKYNGYLVFVIEM